MSINHQSSEIGLNVTQDKGSLATNEHYCIEIIQQRWRHKEFLQLILEKAVQEYNTIDIFEISELLSHGENYCGKLYRIDIQYNRQISKSFVVKDLPDGDYCQRYVRETQFFEREIEFYRNTKDKLEKYFQISAPNAYFVLSNQNFLIMDNLNEFGYQMCDRRTQFDLNHCKIALDCLAKLHCASYNLGNSVPDIYIKSLFCVPIVKSFCESTYSALVDTVCQWNDCSFGEKLKNINLLDRLTNVTEYNPNVFNVLNHGDFWMNNILFQYSATVPIGAKIIDYQKCRFNSPVLDLHEFFFTSIQNLNDIEVLLEFYYGKLMEYFGQLNLNLNEIYSFHQFIDDFNQKLFFGFYSTCAVLSAVCAQSENIIDLTQLSDNDNANLLVNIYKGDHFKRLFLERLKYFEKMNIL